MYSVFIIKNLLVIVCIYINAKTLLIPGIVSPQTVKYETTNHYFEMNVA